MTHRNALADRLAQTKAALDGIFPRWSSDLGDLSTKATDLHKRTAPQLRDFFAAVDRALDAVQRGQIDAATAKGQTIYTEQERNRRATVAINTAVEEYAGAVASATAILDNTAADLQRAGVPLRPQPADAAQEAALTNLRADLLMVLAAVEPDALANRLRDVYADAVASGDELRAWFIAGSSWPSDYMASRGVHHVLPLLAGKLAEAYVGVQRETFLQATTGYHAVEKGRWALRKVLISLPYVLREDLGIE